MISLLWQKLRIPRILSSSCPYLVLHSSALILLLDAQCHQRVQSASVTMVATFLSSYTFLLFQNLHVPFFMLHLCDFPLLFVFTTVFGKFALSDLCRCFPQSHCKPLQCTSHICLNNQSVTWSCPFAKTMSAEISWSTGL